MKANPRANESNEQRARRIKHQLSVAVWRERLAIGLKIVLVLGPIFALGCLLAATESHNRQIDLHNAPLLIARGEIRSIWYSRHGDRYVSVRVNGNSYFEPDIARPNVWQGEAVDVEYRIGKSGRTYIERVKNLPDSAASPTP